MYMYIYIYIVIDEDFGSVCWRHYLLEVHLFTTINDLSYQNPKIYEIFIDVSP